MTLHIFTINLVNFTKMDYKKKKNQSKKSGRNKVHKYKKINDTESTESLAEI